MSREHKRTLRRLLALMRDKQAAHEEFLRKVDKWSAHEDSDINPWEAASHYRKASDELQQHLRDNADIIASAAKAILEQPVPAPPRPLVAPAPSAPLHNRGLSSNDAQEPAEVEPWFMSCSDCGGSGYCTSGTGHWTASESIRAVPVTTPCSRCQGRGCLDFAFPAKSKPGSVSEPSLAILRKSGSNH